MNVNYKTDPIGKARWTWLISGDPDCDPTPVKIGGVSFQSSIVCKMTCDLLGTVRLVIRCSRKGIALKSFAVVAPPKGRNVSAALLERAAHELPAMVREAVAGDRNSITWEGESVTPERVWEIVHAALMPQRGSGEAASEFVYRMWKSEYQPYGRTQKDLARDLGRSYDLVREYVSKETRREATSPANVADAIYRNRKSQRTASAKETIE